jgi:hypothetical protein
MYFNSHHYNYHKASQFRKAAKSTLRYISTRKIDGEKVRIPVFGWKSMNLDDAEVLIQERSHKKPLRFWIVKLSPDIVKENPHKGLDLWDLARKTLDYIREHDLIIDGKPVLRDGKPVKVSIDRNAQFILAQHNDTNIPHVQGLLFFNGRLEKHDLERMREIAHE